MRILVRWTTRLILAAATGIAIAATGAGSAYADGTEGPDTPPAATTPAPGPTGQPGPMDNFPWG